jgi:ATP-dependent Clp protease ATP-binding subunit ClpC
MQYLGQWEQRCEAVIAELSQIEGVLCVESLLDLVRTGGKGPSDSIAAFFTPYIQRGELRLIGEATPAELDACRRLLPGIASLFSVVEIPPFTANQAIAALDQMAGTLRQNLRVDYERGAIEQIYRLFSRFLPYQSFPGKAAAFITDIFDRAAVAKSAKMVATWEVVGGC